ncbi:zinc-binding alcohol dehydrogenase family protein [Streptomyces sp. NPDC014983]|uniref:quinone oxidoreductase family protein n=1 Tax=Streptomyces sp. NPDC014983 TaxID=3364933 RepID=UPI003700F415
MQITQIRIPAPSTPPSALRPVRRELEPPAAGEVTIGVEAAGVSFDDMLMRRGTCPGQVGPPLVPGRDVVGVVTAVGADGTGADLVGRRVAAVVGAGGWADGVNAPLGSVVPVPEGLSPVAAAGIGYAGVLAWYMVHRQARVAAGQTVVVPGAPGWVGTVLVQLADLAGARVIGVSSTRQLAETTRLRFDPVDHWVEDVPSRVAQLAPDGVHAVFDPIGGPNLAKSGGLLREGGALISYGNWFTRDEPAARHRADLAALDGRVIAVDLFHGLRHEELAGMLAEVLAFAAAGRIEPYIAAARPLAEAGSALAEFEQGGLVGRVVLTTERLPSGV